MSDAHTKETQARISPDDAIELLRAGNERFCRGELKNRDLLQQVEATKTGQFPYAAILSCIDSRVPPSLVFDLGVGDSFAARVAGNCVNEDILGSLEFACQVAGAKLVVVMGHSRCGAVSGACNGVELGNLTGLLEKIRPPMESVTTPEDPEQRTGANPEFVAAVTEANIHHGVATIREQSEVLRKLEEEGAIRIVGANYDVASGKVSFLED